MVTCLVVDKGPVVNLKGLQPYRVFGEAFSFSDVFSTHWLFPCSRNFYPSVVRSIRTAQNEDETLHGLSTTICIGDNQSHGRGFCGFEACLFKSCRGCSRRCVDEAEPISVMFCGVGLSRICLSLVWMSVRVMTEPAKATDSETNT